MEAEIVGLRMAAKLGWVGLLVALLLGTPVRSAAQEALPQLAITAELQNLAARAQTVFVGQIVSIERRNSVVEVTFRVEQQVVGTAAATCTMGEWAGLWPPGHNRYSVGQRVLAFLHAASGAGLSSPVHGAEGLVPVVMQGANAPKLLDIRRVAASVVRAPGTPLPTEADGAMQLSDVLMLFQPAQHARAFEPIRLALPGRGHLPVDLPKMPQSTPSPLILGRVQGTGVTAFLAGAR